jgi:hypothetical protein
MVISLSKEIWILKSIKAISLSSWGGSGCGKEYLDDAPDWNDCTFKREHLLW